MTHVDTSKVRAVLDRFATGWRTEDAELLKSLWDVDYPDGSYIASERDRALFGMPATNEYYDETLAAFSITSMEINNVTISVLDDVAHAFCDITIGWKWKGEDYLSYPRATFVLRKRGTEWYIIHYHESIQWQLPAG